MEDDVDIYADLPSFNLNPEKNAEHCNCKELKEELGSLLSKLENIQKTKTNLENNLFSLLITAKAEITRKDRMIDDLRKRLDDITFRRSYNSESPGFSNHKLSHQHTVVTRKYENVPSIHSRENETESHQIQFYHEYKSRKPRDDVNRIPTVFGERLHKRIMEDEEEKKQKALLKLNVEIKTEDVISEENSIIENDKENGSQFVINNDNESNIRRCSSSEPPYRNNLKKRTNEEDDRPHGYKRVKIENDKDKTHTTIEETPRYDLADNPAEYEMKYSLVKLEDQLDAAQSLKTDRVPFCDGRRAASEYRDTKQDQSCTNEWKSEAKSNSEKDHDNSNIRNGLADSSRNSRTASTSNHVLEKFNSGYKKNGYRYSSPGKSYSKSRNDYESLSSRRLRDRSSRTYREKKFDDYKYDSQKRYKNDRSKRCYESDENDRKARYRRRERDNLRDKSRYSSSDAEDKESSRSYKKNKYETRRIKKEATSVLNDKKLHESNKAVAETNFRESSSRTTVNSTGINSSVGKNIELHKVKNENLTESTSVHVVAQKDLDILEEGEILDSPDKGNNTVKISKGNKMEESNVKILPIESIDMKSIPLQNDANSTKWLEAADISTKKIEEASRLLQENSKDRKEIIRLNSNESDMAVDQVRNSLKDIDKYKSHINEDLMGSITQNIGPIEQVRDSDINSNDKNANKRSKDSITEAVIKIKKATDSDIESATKIKELDDSNVEGASKKDINNPNIESVVEVTEVNNFNSGDGIHKIDDDDLRISTCKVATKAEAVLNCDFEDGDKSQAPIEKKDVEVYLNDHNYVQNPSTNVSDLNIIQKSSLLRSERREAASETATSKETKAVKTNKIQSVGVKRTVSSIVKNKKDQQSKGILVSHRRKAVILSDSNASMTVVMNNTNTGKTPSIIDDCNDVDSTLKPRACKISRVTAKATCK